MHNSNKTYARARRSPVPLDIFTRSALAVYVWGAVLAIALMSFYVRVLTDQVHRGETLRQAQRHGVPIGQAQVQRLPPAGDLVTPVVAQAVTQAVTRGGAVAHSVSAVRK